MLIDEIVEKLKQEPDLSTVFLLRDESTDEHLKMLKGVSMKGIKGLTKLKYIHVDSTSVTQNGIQQFHESHPDTKVWDGARFR